LRKISTNEVWGCIRSEEAGEGNCNIKGPANCTGPFGKLINQCDRIFRFSYGPCSSLKRASPAHAPAKIARDGPLCLSTRRRTGSVSSGSSITSTMRCFRLFGIVTMPSSLSLRIVWRTKPVDEVLFFCLLLELTYNTPVGIEHLRNQSPVHRIRHIYNTLTLEGQ
jgi:hypothetical protein